MNTSAPALAASLALVVLVVSAGASHAEVIVRFVQTPEGRIDLYADQGPCRAEVKRAEYVPAKGDPVPGCWVVRRTMVSIVFLDGDIAQVPILALQTAKAA